MSKPTIKDLFKTYKLKNWRRSKFGYSSLLWRIVRNTEEKNYYYMFRDFAAGEYRVLHSGIDKVKFLTPCVLSIFCIVFNLFWIPFIVVTFIILVIVLAVLLIIK